MQLGKNRGIEMKLKFTVFLMILLLAFIPFVTAGPLFMQVRGDVIDENAHSATADLIIKVEDNIFFNETVTGSYGYQTPVYLTTSNPDAKVIFFIDGEELKQINFQDDLIADVDIHVFVEQEQAREDISLIERIKNMNAFSLLLLGIIIFMLYKMFISNKKKLF